MTGGPMLCSTGCSAVCHPRRGQCVAHLVDSDLSHPWLPCAGCRRALDVLLGDAAGSGGALCDAYQREAA